MWKYEIECLRCNCINHIIQANNWKLLNALCIMWEASIYTIKFYIRFIFSTEFRYDVKRVIFCRSRTDLKPKTSIINKTSLSV